MRGGGRRRLKRRCEHPIHSIYCISHNKKSSRYKEIQSLWDSIRGQKWVREREGGGGEEEGGEGRRGEIGEDLATPLWEGPRLWRELCFPFYSTLLNSIVGGLGMGREIWVRREGGD